MQSVVVNVSEKSKADDVILELKRKLSTDDSDPLASQAVREIEDCISDFIEKAASVSQAGTTIRINRSFDVSGVEVKVRLQSPETPTFLERILRAVKGR